MNAINIDTATETVTTGPGAVGLLYLGLYVARPIIDARYGLYLPITTLSPGELVMLALIVGAGFVVALLPALRAYKMSLADGMTVRV
jgi:putative ABC transport system permease protein